MSKLNDILAQLPKLGQRELSMLRAAVDHLLDGSNEGDETRPLYDVMAGSVGRGYLSFHLFQKMTAYRTWRRDSPAVVQFIETTFPQSHKVTKVAIMSFLVSGLIDDMKMLRIPITLGTVTKHIHRLPQVFDNCFPSYRESGLAELVVKAMERK